MALTKEDHEFLANYWNVENAVKTWSNADEKGKCAPEIAEFVLSGVNALMVSRLFEDRPLTDDEKLEAGGLAAKILIQCLPEPIALRA